MSPIQKVKKNRKKLMSFLVFFLMFFSVFMTISFLESNMGVVSGATTGEFSYYKSITIDHTQVPSDLTNFPVLVSISSDSDLVGYSSEDIAFFDGTGAGATQLNHEIELFNSSTGQLIAWVNVTSVSSSSDTVFYMFYGDSDGSSEENPTGVWDSHYLAVWHMNDASGGAKDSTSYNHDATEGTSPTYQASGKIGYGIDFEMDNSEYLVVSNSTDLDGLSGITIECWVDIESTSSRSFIFGHAGTTYSDDPYYLRYDHSAGAYNFIMETDIGGDDTQVASVTSDTTGFKYLCGRWQQDGYLNMFVGGVDDSDSSSNLTSMTNPDNSKYIGRRGTSYCDGIIDELRISDIKRSDAWIDATYNNAVNQTTFISVGTNTTNVGTTVSLVLHDNKFTHSGQLGNTSLSNETGTYYEWAEFNISYDGTNVEYIRINITDIHANITSSNCSYQFSSDNTTWGGLGGNWKSGGDGGFTIILNQTTWTTANGCYGTNPFPISSNTSIWMVEKVTIPTGIGIETYSTTTGTSRTWDAGYYT